LALKLGEEFIEMCRQLLGLLLGERVKESIR
jgi:hypothetical protein